MICCDGIFFDELTRLPYDRYFVRQAQELIRNQLKRPVMISLDISNFKYFNRMYGYKEGDKYGKNVLRLLKTHLSRRH